MIIGEVNHRNEAIIPISIRDSIGQILTLDAIIDTGFSDHLTLPFATITALQLTYSTTETYSLGNNSQVSIDLYHATVAWDGNERDILVLSTEANPLLGMSLLKGFRVIIDVVDGGNIRIEKCI